MIITGIAYHCYLDPNLTWIGEVHKKYPEQFILMSECCQHFRPNTDPLTPASLGDWDEAKGYIQRVMKVIGWPFSYMLQCASVNVNTC